MLFELHLSAGSPSPDVEPQILRAVFSGKQTASTTIYFGVYIYIYIYLYSHPGVDRIPSFK